MRPDDITPEEYRAALRAPDRLVALAAQNALRDERVRAAERERIDGERMQRLEVARDSFRDDAARWKAEAERLREDMQHALMVADETASMQCECDGYYRCGSCPTRIANRAEDVAEILKRSLDSDWGSALSAGGGTDA